MSMKNFVPPQNSLIEPELPPTPVFKEEAMLTVVGILEKYVNIGQGFKHRLFVLERGVLRYYKISEPNVAAHIPNFLEGLRENGNFKIIGNQLLILEQKQNKTSQSKKTINKKVSFEPTGEIHLQVANVRESKSGDEKRFSIHSGTKRLTCRADSVLDRKAWLESLLESKAILQGVSVNSLFPTYYFMDEDQVKFSSGTPSINTFEERTLSVIIKKLSDGGVSPQLISFVDNLLKDQHRFYLNYMQEEAKKRIDLIHYIRSLEENNRELEQQFVMRERHDAMSEIASIQGDMAINYIDNDDSGEDEDEDEDEESDLFYDCDFDETLLNEPKDSINSTPSMNMEIEPIDKVIEEEEEEASLNGNENNKTGEISSPPNTPEKNNSEDILPKDSNQAKNLENWLKEQGIPKVRRDRLPRPQQKEKKVGLWSIIKQCVGKDLTKICLPVYFNEPISALQRSCEDLEYSYLIDKALTFPKGSMERLMHIAVFAISSYGGTVGRLCKPFNPLLGETFEFVHPEKGYRFLGEKVVHHPTIFALHCEGRGWTIDADSDLKSKFWGASIELHPVGSIVMRTEDGEVYKWNKVVTSINNLIIGKLDIDHYGLMKVKNVTEKITAKIKFHAKSFFDKTPHRVEGFVEGPNGKIEGNKIFGIWSKEVSITINGSDPEIIWQKNEGAPEPTKYNFSPYTILLNEITENIRGYLAPTDSRLRPDQRYLEQGLYDEANASKLRLEKKQRASRKALEAGQKMEPRWFKAVPGAIPSQELTFIYNGEYWKARDDQCFIGCRDIYGE